MSRRSRRRARQALRDAEDEYRRLLYVAMTRAADRLIVCGAEGVRGRPHGCWYDLVRKRARAVSRRRNSTTARAVLRYRKPAGAAAALRATGAAAANQNREPRSFRSGCANRRRRSRRGRSPLSPSSAFDEEIGRVAHAAGSAAERQKALEKGRICASADAVVARYSARAPRRTRPNAIWPRPRRILPERARADRAPGAGHSCRREIRRKCSRREAVPRCRSSAVSRQRTPRRRWCPAKWTGWRSPGDTVLIADYKTDRAVPARLDEVEALCGAACALSRGAVAPLSRQDRPRRAGLYRGTAPDRRACRGPWTPRSQRVIETRRHAPVNVP